MLSELRNFKYTVNGRRSKELRKGETEKERKKREKETESVMGYISCVLVFGKICNGRDSKVQQKNKTCQVSTLKVGAHTLFYFRSAQCALSLKGLGHECQVLQLQSVPFLSFKVPGFKFLCQALSLKAEVSYC